MNLFPVLCVFGGAGFGAVLRYGLGLLLNPLLPALPLGTLAANLGGGFLAGFLADAFLLRAPVPPALHPLLVTGLLGGLTTFSTFSLEAATLLHAARPGAAAVLVAAHVAGSILLTFAGMATARAVLG